MIRRTVRRTDEDGYAMMFVIVAMFTVAVVVAATVAIAMSNIRPARANADSQAALAAAQAGVDDFVMRLNACDAYWNDARRQELGQTFTRSCPTSNDSPALLGWADAPGTDGAVASRFSYDILSTPDGAATPGRIRLQVTGQNADQRRKVTVEFGKRGFLQYIYYTEVEATSPATMASRYAARQIAISKSASLATWGCQGYSNGNCVKWVDALDYKGITATAANVCSKQWYDDGSGIGRRAASDDSTLFNGTPVPEQFRYHFNDGNYTGLSSTNRGCEISFGPNDVISGRLYSKDAIMLSGSATSKPTFKGRVQTYWQPSYSPAPRDGKPWRDNGGYAGYNTAEQKPEITQEDVSLPPSNTEIRTVAASSTGCVYTGPTRIKFRSDGRYEVTSPRSAGLSTSCGSGLSGGSTQIVNGPSSGVIYVDPFTGTCNDPTASSKLFGLYPVAGDITKYTCKAGDVFIEGDVKGRYTVASANRVIVTGDTKYVSGRSQSGTDVLGLIAGDGNVEIYHPVGCSGTVSNFGTCVNDSSEIDGNYGDSSDNYDNLSALRDIEVDAALLSVSNSFTVQNYDKAPQLGTLTIFGGVYQKQRGAVALSGSTGYVKNYIYDTRLVSYPPPSFLKPAKDPWLVSSFAEDQR